MIEIYKSKDGWRWRVKGKNGEIVASGEAYSSRSSALRGVTTLIEILNDEEVSVRFLAPPPSMLESKR